MKISVVRPVSKKQLKNNISVETTKAGFTVWYKNGKQKFWLVDGSCLLEDGKIDLGRSDLYSVNTRLYEGGRTIRIVNIKKSKN